MDDFIDVYAVTTGAKQRVPRDWIGHPVLGAGIRKTPAQRALDGDIPSAPTSDATAKDIKAYADAAGIDIKGMRAEEILQAVQDLDHAPAVMVADPVAELPPADDTAVDTQDTGDTGSPDETPATGADEGVN